MELFMYFQGESVEGDSFESIVDWKCKSLGYSAAFRWNVPDVAEIFSAYFNETTLYLTP